MLLLLFLIYWVQQPMRFTPLSKRAFALLAALAFGLIPFDGPWHEWNGGTCQAQAPFQSSYADGQSRDPGTRSSRSLGRRGRASDQDQASGESVQVDAAKRLREGTLVPPTNGRVAMMGRRWVFITDPPEESASNTDGTPATGPEATETDRRFGGGREEGGFGRRNQASSSRSPSVAAGANRGLLSQTTSLSYTEATEDDRALQYFRVPQILLVENLMLQRIAEAIRQDGSDDRWILAGEITEFFDENRMVIKTATRGRAFANPTPNLP